MLGRKDIIVLLKSVFRGGCVGGLRKRMLENGPINFFNESVTDDKGKSQELVSLGSR